MRVADVLLVCAPCRVCTSTRVYTRVCVPHTVDVTCCVFSSSSNRCGPSSTLSPLPAPLDPHSPYLHPPPLHTTSLAPEPPQPRPPTTHTHTHTHTCARAFSDEHVLVRGGDTLEHGFPEVLGDSAAPVTIEDAEETVFSAPGHPRREITPVLSAIPRRHVHAVRVLCRSKCVCNRGVVYGTQ